MNKELHLPCAVGLVSDGYHTFDELYEHRHALFLLLMTSMPDRAWFSAKHADGTMMENWFIAGIHLPAGDVTYHLPMRLFETAINTGAKAMPVAPEWDGHTSKDVLKRLYRALGNRSNLHV